VLLREDSNPKIVSRLRLSAKRQPGWRGPTVAVIIALAVLGQACSSTSPERPRKVARTTRDFFDESRPNWKGKGPRPLSTTIWYPAVASAREQEWKVGGLPVLPAFRAGWASPNATLDAAETKLPLVLLSHGTGGAAAQLAWLAESLATRGYIAAAINHHGNTAVEEYLPQGFILWWERAEDLRRVLDRLVEDPVLGPHIDRSRIGAAGFSLGGYTVLAAAGAVVSAAALREYCAGPQRTATSCELPPEAGSFTLEEVLDRAEHDPLVRESMARREESYRDERIKAVFAIAPVLGPALKPESLAQMSVPVRIVVGEADTQAPPRESAVPITQAIPTAKLRLIPNVAHYTFLAECTIWGRLLLRHLCSDPSEVIRQEIHRQVAEEAVAFFGRALNVRSATALSPR